MNKNILLIIVSMLCLSCSSNSAYQHKVILKNWHISPSSDPRSSTIYPFVVWDNIMKIKIGMNKNELKELINDVQNYHHPINAIVFTKDPNGINYELAIKLSKEGIVEDLSFKRIDF